METFNLNKAVKRNLTRFPEDFMFQLSKEEAESLRFQIGISNGRGGRRYLPYVFTEHGVVMLSSVLSSERAVQMNVMIVRAFVKLREMLGSHKDLANKIAAIERCQHEHGPPRGRAHDGSPVDGSSTQEKTSVWFSGRYRIGVVKP
ncbi:MAG: ORF6N domain-containing protein [Bryobacteraceae bacterium]